MNYRFVIGNSYLLRKYVISVKYEQLYHNGQITAIRFNEKQNLLINAIIRVLAHKIMFFYSDAQLKTDDNISQLRPVKPLPVLVYIHGGVFRMRSGDAGPHYFMDHDIVFVTFNYRLGIFGTLI